MSSYKFCVSQQMVWILPIADQLGRLNTLTENVQFFPELTNILSEGYMDCLAKPGLAFFWGSEWFAVVNSNTIKYARVEELGISGSIAIAALDPHDGLWVITTNRVIYQYDGQKWEAFGTLAGDFNVRDIKIFMSPDEILWILAGGDGLFAWSKSENSLDMIYKTSQVGEIPWVVEIFPDNDGRLWFFTSEEGYVYQDNKVEEVELPETDGQFYITDAVFDEQTDVIYISTSEGIFAWRLPSTPPPP